MAPATSPTAGPPTRRPRRATSVTPAGRHERQAHALRAQTVEPDEVEHRQQAREQRRVLGGRLQLGALEARERQPPAVGEVVGQLPVERGVAR